jgi:hypothetical protein
MDPFVSEEADDYIRPIVNHISHGLTQLPE